VWGGGSSLFTAACDPVIVTTFVTNIFRSNKYASGYDLCAERYTGLGAKRTILIFNSLMKIHAALLALLHMSEATKPVSTHCNAKERQQKRRIR
jgi:hypothetical protein